MSRRKIVNFALAEDRQSAELTFYHAPTEEGGPQDVAEKVSFSVNDISADLLAPLAIVGFFNLFGSRYKNLEEPDHAEVRKAYDNFVAIIKDGTWTPGRTPGETEPDDIVVAIAEATGRPVFLVQQEIDERLQLDDNSQPKRDKRGRTMRVFNARVLTQIASDPKIKPILARLAKERAERLAKEARTHKGDAGAPSTLGSFFTSAELVQEAAN